MALHPVRLPQSARELRRIVAMQQLLLKALCAQPMRAALINEAWLQAIWKTQDAAWIEKFCRKRKYSVLDPIKVLATASLAVRKAIFVEFCRQSRARSLFEAGGQFQQLPNVAGVTATLAAAVQKLFLRFYQFLSHETNAGWSGYVFPRGRSIKKDSYKADFDSTNCPTMTVCPYCDGANDEPELDHYYPKETFPLLSCSQWNLVPACHNCNKLSAKSDRIALSLTAPNPSADWLHPYFCPASLHVQIKLSGSPKNSIPQLHSPDPAEQARLINHTSLIRTLSERWTKGAAQYHDRLVRQVNRALKPTNTIDELVRDQLVTHLDDRGRFPSSMIHAAVCQAVLDRRPEYLEEFNDSNPPTIDAI